jgi:hypothetical protein
LKALHYQWAVPEGASKHHYWEQGPCILENHQQHSQEPTLPEYKTNKPSVESEKIKLEEKHSKGCKSLLYSYQEKKSKATNLEEVQHTLRKSPDSHTQRDLQKNTCSRTSSLGELRSWTKIGTAPWSMTTRVWSDVPDAILVSAHAASNCIGNMAISIAWMLSYKPEPDFQCVKNISSKYIHIAWLRSKMVEGLQPASNSKKISRTFAWPEAMQVISITCSWGKSLRTRNSTKRGTTPADITSSIGGLRSAQKETW